MRKGTIVLVPFPFTDLSGQKVRPALVLFAPKRGEDCIVAFITSGKQKKKYVFSITVTATLENGLKTDSFVRADKIASLQKKIVLGELGLLEPSIMRSINKHLKTMFKI